jgi:hypothetical protein
MTLPSSFISYGSTATSSTFSSHLSPNPSLSSTPFTSHNFRHMTNILAILLEAGIFSLPHAFHKSGILGGIIILIFVSLMSYITINILLSAQHSLYQQTGEIFSYPEIVSHYFSSSPFASYWTNSIKIATAVSCLGGCASFMIFIGQISSQELDFSFEWTVFVITVPMIFLSWIRSFKELSIFTGFGVFAMTLSIVAIIYDGFPIQSDRLHVQIFVPSSSLTFLGNATFLFTIHYCALAMGAEDLRHHRCDQQTKSSPSHPSQESFPLICEGNERQGDDVPNKLSFPMKIAFFFATVIFSCLGLVGPLIYSAAHHVRSESPSPLQSITATHHPSIPPSIHLSLSPYLSLPFSLSLSLPPFLSLYLYLYLCRDSEGNIVQGCEEVVCQNIVLNLPPGRVRSFSSS